MKQLICIILFLGFSSLYSQTIDLNQLVAWRGRNYKFLSDELVKKGWEKVNVEKTTNYVTTLYFLDKGTINEKVLTLMCSDNYLPDNNILSYNVLVDENYYMSFIAMLNSSGFLSFKVQENDNVTSNYYKSNQLTIIVSTIETMDSQMKKVKFLTINLSTNENFRKAYKE